MIVYSNWYSWFGSRAVAGYHLVLVFGKGKLLEWLNCKTHNSFREMSKFVELVLHGSIVHNRLITMAFFLFFSFSF